MPKTPVASKISLTGREYRNTIGLFATGVTVLLLGEGEDVRAMTANAVTSLSLDPLLLICCIAKRANCAAYFKVNEHFSVNILSRDQEALSNYFAGMWPDDAAPPDFEFIGWEGGTRLARTGAGVGCVVQEILEGGDHWIVVGRVVALWRQEESLDPLLFFQGRYRGLAEA